jgi:phosphoglycerol transferase MdoB-like AlkP superfamily enzyme
MKNIWDWFRILFFTFVLWIILFRSTFSIVWKIIYVLFVGYFLLDSIIWGIRYYKHFSLFVIVTEESITGETANKKRTEIKWKEIIKIEEVAALVTSMFVIHSTEHERKIYILGFHLHNFDKLKEIIYEKIKEHNIPHIKKGRWF